MDAERRRTKRIIMRVPMRIRGIKEMPSAEREVESLNISIRGAYFAAEGNFQVGEKLEVRLKMPEIVAPGQITQWCFVGRVTHVDRLGSDGKIGVGVHFLYYSAENTAPH